MVVNRLWFISHLLFFSLLTLTAQDSDSENCPEDFTPRLQRHQMARVTPGDPNNVRVLPSSSSELRGKIPGGAEFRVTGGYVCADGYVWWLVSYEGMEGWTVEGNQASYWTEPLTPTPSLTPSLTPTPSITPTPSVTPTSTPSPTFTPTLQPFPSEREVIQVDNAERLELLEEFPLTCKNPDELLFNSSGEKIAVICDYTVYVWDVATQTLDHQIAPKRSDYRYDNLTFSPINPTLLVVTSRIEDNNSAQSELEFWDLDSGEITQNLFLEARVTDVKFTPDGTGLVFGQNDDTIRVLDAEQLIVTDALSHTRVRALEFSSDGKWLLSVGETGSRIWDWATKELIQTNDKIDSIIENQAIIADGLVAYPDFKAMSYGGVELSVWIWDWATDTTLASSPEFPEYEELVHIYNLKFSSIVSDLVIWTDRRKILNFWNYGYDDYSVEIDLQPYLNRNDTSTLSEFPSINEPDQIAISPDGTLIAIGGSDIQLLGIRR